MIQQIVKLLAGRTITTAAELTHRHGIAPGDVVAELYTTLPAEMPEDEVQEIVSAYEAQLEAKWLQK